MYTKGVLSKWYTKGGAGFWGRALAKYPPPLDSEGDPCLLWPGDWPVPFPPRASTYKTLQKPNSQVSEVNAGLLWHGDWPAPIPCDESLSSWAASQLRTLRNVQQLVLKTGCQQTPRK